MGFLTAKGAGLPVNGLNAHVRTSAMLWVRAGLCAISLALLASAQNTSDALTLISARRKLDLGSAAVSPAKASAWLAQQQGDGTWPDVNYLTGCGAQFVYRNERPLYMS